VQGACHGEVHVEYRRLRPGTFVRFTPQSPAFQKALEEHSVDVQALLQDTLMRHTALSEGDWVEVDVPGGERAGPQRLQARCESRWRRMQWAPVPAHRRAGSADWRLRTLLGRSACARLQSRGACQLCRPDRRSSLAHECR
jgi:hypothetical protein